MMMNKGLRIEKGKFTMTELKDKIVFITGASSGIGAACAQRFAEEGAKLLLCARRIGRLNNLTKKLSSAFKTEIHSFELDVRNKEQVDLALNSLPEKWKRIDILINNAGLARGFSKLQEGLLTDWEEMIDTNIKGLLYITRKIVPEMIEHGSGDIINIGSIAGREVYPNGNVYCATKHAVDALTKGLRIDLLGTPLRVCTIDPGMVDTEFSLVRFQGNREKADNVYDGMEPLTAEDIADAVFYCASRPSHVQIAEILIFPTAQRSATIVHRA
jgi:NADP-dependent 3-hydroxy acid dehydrogenase YdfG